MNLRSSQFSRDVKENVDEEPVVNRRDMVYFEEIELSKMSGRYSSDAIFSIDYLSTPAIDLLKSYPIVRIEIAETYGFVKMRPGDGYVDFKAGSELAENIERLIEESGSKGMVLERNYCNPKMLLRRWSDRDNNGAVGEKLENKNIFPSRYNAEYTPDGFLEIQDKKTFNTFIEHTKVDTKNILLLDVYDKYKCIHNNGRLYIGPGNRLSKSYGQVVLEVNHMTEVLELKTEN